MKFKLLFLLLFSNILMAEKITIAVAANVSYAIEDLKKEFNKEYPEVEVQVILGSTGKLTAQIMNGAPYDILMGANMMYPEKLYEESFAVTKPEVYAQGSLALVSAKKYDLSKGIHSIQNGAIKRIAIANPKTAPYGIATVEALKNAKLYEEVKEKFVYGESISQTVTYARRATDLGFIAKSSLYSPQMKHFKKDENWVEVDPELYTPIDQGIVMLKRDVTLPGAKAFYVFIMGEKAKRVFEAFGYRVSKN
jgi:molybdate transport system substrate-binding protein